MAGWLAVSQAVIPRVRADLAEVVNVLKDESATAEARNQQAILKLEATAALLVKKFRLYFPKESGAKDTE